MVRHGPQFENGLGFQLSNSLSGHVDLSTDLGQRQGFFTAKAEAEFEDFLLPFIELRQPAAEMFLLDAAVHPLHRLLAVGIGDQFPQCASVFLSAGMRIE